MSPIMYRSYQLCHTFGKEIFCCRGTQVLKFKNLGIMLAAAFSAAILTPAARAELHVLVDQVGYETSAPKQALVLGTAQDHPRQFVLVDTDTGKTVLTGDLHPAGSVYNWTTAWGDTYWLADFSAFKMPGHYAIEVSGPGGDAHSCAFAIEDDLLERETLSNVVYYFKGQRVSGLFNQADRHLPLPGEPGKFVDVHGGWYDATGDYGVHFSQLNLTSYFNTQQVPLVDWSLLKSYETLKARDDDNFSEYERRLLDEGIYGADFLVRMKRPDGSFFQNVDAPGKGKLAKDRRIGDPNWRLVVKTSTSSAGGEAVPEKGPHAYEVSFRSGGGMAIAALALASTMPIDGDFTRATYLRSAEEAFDFLSKHNRELLNDGKENILDDYCALMAATELYRASHDAKYLDAANRRAESLMDRLTTTGKYHDYWRADNGTRPFFNPSDAGLPVVSLLEYDLIAASAQQQQVRETVKKSLQFELGVTADVNNPFGYARQLVRMGDGQVRPAFFFPHDTEAAPWWQGEDARLASLAAAARMAAPLFVDDPAFHAQLEDYAWNQFHWILGRNPYDSSLLMGSGHGNKPYMFFRSWKYTSAPGAIVNGITAGLDSEDGIAFNLGYAVTGKDDDWRWTEQWLPHDAWYLYAVSLPHE